MELTILTFIIVCPLVFLASFVDAVAGGGGLIALPAYLLAGVPMHNAIATNKLSSSAGTVFSTVRLCRNKFVDWGLALPCISMALLGSYIGANLALRASDTLLRWMLIPVLPVVSFYVLKKKEIGDNSGIKIGRKKQWLICALSSLAVGCYDGFYGPGTGTFLLLLYTGAAKMDVRRASGNMKLANLSSNVTALVVFLFSGNIIFPLGLAASAFSIAGHYIGAGMVMKNGSRIVRPLILVVITLLFIKIIFDL
ncbi:MAG TPA: TSUP family transporter [Candidatus Blautia faecavium]|uniref:Probable membrane transporter protein n=1 Tax=Candidatus Blautia faecavium TaxID=2838487 RepID=A0A9D2LRI0_9FIRM|nr:TSUP family transporter [Candidatus Blautia faecavium]